MEVIVRRFDIATPARYVDSSYEIDKIENLPEDLKEFRQNIKNIVFLTSNQNKLREIGSGLNLNNIKLSCPAVSLNLPEIQDSDILNIVQDKCLRAYEATIKDNCGVPGDSTVVLVEDTCLNFKALGGMPGPYVKWFLDAIGPEGLFRMLKDFADKTAEAICIYALMGQPRREDGNQAAILFFRGVARGQIVEPRRLRPGSGQNWGWDPIFEEGKLRLTFAEMTQETKSRFSHRAHALSILRKFLS